MASTFHIRLFILFLVFTIITTNTEGLVYRKTGDKNFKVCASKLSRNICFRRCNDDSECANKNKKVAQVDLHAIDGNELRWRCRCLADGSAQRHFVPGAIADLSIRFSGCARPVRSHLVADVLAAAPCLQRNHSSHAGSRPDRGRLQADLAVSFAAGNVHDQPCRRCRRGRRDCLRKCGQQFIHILVISS